ncbi:MAG TPA: lipoyl(octanoyl) transferase LipB [Burkholderiaceae bacterium]|nr:lipoyl(octanoyl) transferase LipB [Burkholderiaceae bacterium]
MSSPATASPTPAASASPSAAPPQTAPIVRQLGRAAYLPTWDAMRAFTAARTAATPDELWVVEHPPVFTLGIAGRREHILAARDIPVIAADRGGQVTYHGPGQVVAYTLIDLRRQGIYVKELVYRIEQAVIQVLQSYGVDGRRVRGAPGIYVPWPAAASTGEFAGLAKIAALGIKIAKGCSYHGVAFNVAMDLEPFARVNPCGYADLTTVDLAALGVGASWQEVAEQLSARLAAHFPARAQD